MGSLGVRHLAGGLCVGGSGIGVQVYPGHVVRLLFV